MEWGTSRNDGRTGGASAESGVYWDDFATVMDAEQLGIAMAWVPGRSH